LISFNDYLSNFMTLEPLLDIFGILNILHEIQKETKQDRIYTLKADEAN